MYNITHSPWVMRRKSPKKGEFSFSFQGNKNITYYWRKSPPDLGNENG